MKQPRINVYWYETVVVGITKDTTEKIHSCYDLPVNAIKILNANADTLLGYKEKNRIVLRMT